MTGLGIGMVGARYRRPHPWRGLLDSPPAIPTEVPMRRIGLAVVAVSLLVAPLVAEAQQAGKVYRIGVIINAYSVADAVGPNPRNESVAALLRGLGELGYVYGRDFCDGATLVTELRSSEARSERSRAIAAELAELRVDVIVAAGPAVDGVKLAAIATPVVMGGVGDPVQAGFVTSLARPGGSFTGISLQTPGLTASGYSY